MKLKKVGMRTIKTGITSMLCVLLVKNLVENVFFSAVGCVVSVQDTVKGSMKSGRNRVLGTIIGGTVGFLLAMIKPGDPVLCGIGTIITIYTCNILNLNAATIVSCVTFYAVHLSVGTNNPVFYAMHRAIDTSVGVIFGVVINYLLARPDYLETTLIELNNLEQLSIDLVRLKILNKEKFNLVKFQRQFQRLEKFCSKLVDELDYSINKTNTSKIQDSIDICRELYFHMQSIELLEQRLYLNKTNYNNLKKLYNLQEINWDIDEDESPVFNYHLRKIIEEINELKNLKQTYIL